MTIEDLYQIGALYREQLASFRAEIQICGSGTCRSAGAAEIQRAFESVCEEEGIRPEIRIVTTGCMGLCGQGPLLRVLPGDVTYTRITAGDAERIIREHVINGKPLKERMLPEDYPFFTRQTPVVLEHMGRIDPESIEDYIAHGGYEALAKAVTYQSPEHIILEIRNAGLRGRGGGGYPTGLKWDIVRRGTSQQKYVVCNADEGDPGAFMDRAMLEGNPHAILEGMAVAGYAVGATQGFVYVRGEYPLAVDRMKRAITEAERKQLLGNRIFDSGFSFRVDLRMGAGAFVSGEETALLHSIEGKRGQPNPRPPYPSQVGLWGKPTVVNNVETFANVAPIIHRGARWFQGIGTKRSTGTKVFALAGRVRDTGLIEVPMGTTLREVIFDIGGGITDGGSFKAVQTGGPSGGCIPEKHLDIPVDYESLAQAGSIMGSGGMIVMDDSSCMVDVAAYFMEFCQSESCGKCIPCRVGTVQLSRLLDRIRRGVASEQDIETLEELCVMVKDTSLCGLGQAAPNPVISALHFFRPEFERHYRDHVCEAGVCPVHSTEAAGDAAGIESGGAHV
ncbi:SLBB domain-containing protein [bacterium]|nr:SLBB domain-containing protein [bacterium]